MRRLQVRQKIAERSQLQDQPKVEPTEVPQPVVDTGTEDGPIFIAFARVFSGTLRSGQELYVLGPKYDPSTMMDSNVDPSLTLKV